MLTLASVASVSGVEVRDHPQMRKSSAGRGRRLNLFLEHWLAHGPLPSELRWVLEEAFQAPDKVQTVGQIAVRARVDRRTCERWFTRVGLPSPRHFLASARVLYAHRLLQDPGFTVEDVAQRLGYAQVKTLQHTPPYLGRRWRVRLPTRSKRGAVAQRFLAPIRVRSPRRRDGREKTV